MPLRSSRSHPQPNHAGGGRAHGLCARALGYSSLPCKRGGPRGRPGRVAAWVCAHPCATFSSKKVDETLSTGETVSWLALPASPDIRKQPLSLSTPSVGSARACWPSPAFFVFGTDRSCGPYQASAVSWGRAWAQAKARPKSPTAPQSAARALQAYSNGWTVSYHLSKMTNRFRRRRHRGACDDQGVPSSRRVKVVP